MIVKIEVHDGMPFIFEGPDRPAMFIDIPRKLVMKRIPVGTRVAYFEVTKVDGGYELGERVAKPKGWGK